MSQIVKTGLAKSMNKHMKFCKLRVIFQIKETPFVSKILFLKHYGQVRFINFCEEAAQPPTLLRPIDSSK